MNYRPNAVLFSVANLLADGELMPKPRYQDPTVQQSRNGSWYIRPYIDVIGDEGPERRKKTIVLGPSSIGKREAVVRKNSVMQKVNRSDYMIQAQIPVGDFLDYYLKAHVANLSTSTQAKYRCQIKNHIRPAFGGLALCEVTGKKIEEWLWVKAADKASWATRADLKNILSGIFTKAKHWGHWHEANPVDGVDIGRKRSVRERRKLTDDQTRRLLAALPPDVRMLCSVCLFCTLRISEALGLQEKHLDFATGLVLVRQRFYRGNLDLTKNEKSIRDVPFGYLADELARFCKGDPGRFVFQIETHPGWAKSERRGVCRDDRDILQHFVRPAAVALGFYWKGFGFHSLRREAITAFNASIGLTQTMRMSGHSTADMSLLYTLGDKDEQERAVRGFQDRIIGKPEGRPV